MTMTTPPNEQPQDARGDLDQYDVQQKFVRGKGEPLNALVYWPDGRVSKVGCWSLPGGLLDNFDMQQDIGWHTMLSLKQGAAKVEWVAADIFAEGANEMPSSARPAPTKQSQPCADGRKDADVGEPATAGEQCIAIIRKYLLHDSQRAVSWHEVQDCIEAIRAAQQAPHTAEEKTR